MKYYPALSSPRQLLADNTSSPQLGLLVPPLHRVFRVLQTHLRTGPAADTSRCTLEAAGRRVARVCL
jgi:hypothetical protein